VLEIFAREMSSIRCRQISSPGAISSRNSAELTAHDPETGVIIEAYQVMISNITITKMIMPAMPSQNSNAGLSRRIVDLQEAPDLQLNRGAELIEPDGLPSIRRTIITVTNQI
jgi:hypothetical protein